MKKKRILFIASHRPGRAPGQRFRFEQYFSFLGQHGFDCELSFIISAEDDKKLYLKGHYLEKYGIHRRAVATRSRDAARADDFNIIFIFREALVTGSTKFERLFRKSKAKIVFDFDDAIWHLDVSDANRMFSFLKNPDKTSAIIALSDIVFAGNNYLADYAKKFNSNVVIVPTTIDTSEYILQRTDNNPEKIIIGWSGSITTIKHFEFALPFLKILRKKYGSRLEIKVIGDVNYSNEELGIKGIAWNKENEIRDLSTFDIGIMPLPDDEWANGKCGLKGLQYMALGIPTLMSPVGVNSDIVQNGINGFLPSTIEQWVSDIGKLIDSPELRKKMGEAARRTVEEKYSVNAWKEKYLELFT
ncbi:MAG TPA: glycosyltransferase family 4 protein, partial [Bacteroidia bacterium]|nr:glycosyltransferase family 4 protein [Bacteroidia bacterium]